MVVRRIIIWKRREILIALRAVVIPSAAEVFLALRQYHIGTVRKRRLGATYFYFRTSFVYRSARKISRLRSK